MFFSRSAQHLARFSRSTLNRSIMKRQYPGASSSTRSITTSSAQGPLGMLYKSVFRSNIAYALYVVTGAVLLETVYTATIDQMWEASNSGKLFHHIDQSKWKFHLDEDEEEEDEDDE